MSIKCLKKYLSQNLLKWHLQGSITAAFDFNYNDYNYMFDMIIICLMHFKRKTINLQP